MGSAEAELGVMKWIIEESVTRPPVRRAATDVYSRPRENNMGLRLKFNLVLLVVFVLGLGVTGYVSYELLHRNAREEVLRNAGVMMEAALSMRSYTVGQVRPNLVADPDKFLPQSVPAFGATEIMTLLRKKYPDYAYKEATLNPTNPRNRAVEWETDIVNAFRNDAVAERDHGHARDAHRALALPRAAVPDQGRRLPLLPHHGRSGAGRRWSRSTGRATASAGSRTRSSARRSSRCRWRCRSATPTARSSPS